MTTEDGPTVRDRWISEVLRTPHLTDAVRVALLAVARHEMDEDGMVEFRINDLAEWIGRSRKRAGERITFAIESDYLERISRGQKNGPGRYRAALPGGRSSGHPGGTKTSPVFGTPGGPEEKSLGDGSQGKETSGLRDTRGSRRSSFDPTVFGTPGGPEDTAPPIRNRARAHSKQPPQPQTTHQTDSDHATGGQVVQLFDDKNTTEKKHTPARKRASEPASDDHAFAAFWSAYPRKVAKGAARKAWAKAIKDGADPADIILGARRYATNPRRRESDIRYTAHPATWLNAERWTDEDEPAPTTPAANIPTDSRQQATNDLFNRAMARARARDAQEGHR